MTKPHTIIRAEYANLIQPFTSTEQTRYYLNGFFVEPRAAGGVAIVATDGHVLGIFRDDDGSTVAPVIWQLSKATVKACQAKREMREGRWLIIDPASDGTPFRHACRVVEHDKASDAAKLPINSPFVVHMDFATAVDGTFPSWQRVLPTLTGQPTNTGYATVNLAKFGPVAGSTGAHRRNNGPLMIHDSEDGRGPALVMTARDDFAGVLMPMVKTRPSERELPDWLFAPAPAVDQAAAA